MESSRLAVDVTDKWLRFGHPWEIVRSEIACDVKFSGRTESYYDGEGRYRVRWAPEKVVKGVAYDTPVPGYRVHSANLLRLWKAEAAGTAREPAKSQVFSLASSIRPESMAEGVARIWW